VSKKHGVPAEVRLYDRLFRSENPGEEGDDFLQDLNPDSMEVRQGVVEPALATLGVGERIQFERVGYFCVDKDTTRRGRGPADPQDQGPADPQDRPVYNRTIGLRDSWANKQGK
jgi:glutaminyl-tRNA synthetase